MLHMPIGDLLGMYTLDIAMQQPLLGTSSAQAHVLGNDLIGPRLYVPDFLLLSVVATFSHRL
jgi:hypothetical protein